MAGAVPINAILDDNSRVPMLCGENYSDWKEQILLTLGCMDLDLALRVDEPPIPTESSTPTQKADYERWDRSNRLSLMLIKSRINKGIRGSIPDCDKAGAYMKAIEEQFVSSDKALASTLMNKLSSMRHDKRKGVREHIMEMRDIAAKLKSLDVGFTESFLVQFILNSLPQEYGPFKISYNTHKEKWSINELLTMCVQEEGRLKHEVPESACLVTHDKENAKGGNRNLGTKGVQMQKKGKKMIKCFFCKKDGHMKKECHKYKKWLEKKGLSKPEETSGK